MYGSVFLALSHFRSASIDTVHLFRLPLLIHWFMCCIFYGVTTHFRQRLIVARPCHWKIIMVGRVLLVHFMMKCAMWTVVFYRAHLKNVR